MWPNGLQTKKGKTWKQNRIRTNQSSHALKASRVVVKVAKSAAAIKVVASKVEVKKAANKVAARAAKVAVREVRAANAKVAVSSKVAARVANKGAASKAADDKQSLLQANQRRENHSRRFFIPPSLPSQLTASKPDAG
jgi:hypothetical protein